MGKYFGIVRKLGYGFLSVGFLNMLVGILYGRYFFNGINSLVMIALGIGLIVYSFILKSRAKG